MHTAQVITASDRCSAGLREDTSGPLACKLLGDLGLKVMPVVVVPDQVDLISATISQAVTTGIDLIFTTGGTGVTPTDVTPQATAPLLDYEIPGLAAAIRMQGLPGVPAAVLSRGLVGVASHLDQETGKLNRCIVVNAPGSPGGVKDAVNTLKPIINHLLEQLAGSDH